MFFINIYFIKLFISFFKSLIDRNITLRMELKNGLEISGVLTYVDANMNFNISNIIVHDSENFPHLVYINKFGIIYFFYFLDKLIKSLVNKNNFL